MFRPQIKILDCTVRDGGLINQWQFNDDFVRKVFVALSQSGVDYMEIGYKSSEKTFPGLITAHGSSVQRMTLKG